MNADQRRRREVELWRFDLDKVRGFMDRLVAALAMEETQGMDRIRWGTFSHRWNRELRDVVSGIRATCQATIEGHLQTHKLAFGLFAAWQEIHYSITRDQPAERGRLDALSALLDEAEAVLRLLEAACGTSAKDHEK